MLTLLAEMFDQEYTATRSWLFAVGNNELYLVPMDSKREDRSLHTARQYQQQVRLSENWRSET